MASLVLKLSFFILLVDMTLAVEEEPSCPAEGCATPGPEVGDAFFFQKHAAAKEKLMIPEQANAEKSDRHAIYLQVWSHMKNMFGVQKAVDHLRKVADKPVVGAHSKDQDGEGSLISAATDSVEIVQSVQFAQNEINDERFLLCPEANQLTLSVTEVSVQMTTSIDVHFTFTVEGGNNPATATVSWTDDGSSGIVETLALEQLTEEHFLGHNAKLDLSMPACALDGTVKVALGQEFHALRPPNHDEYYYGVDMKREIEEYENAKKTKQNFTKASVSRCTDTDNGASDPYGDNCATYASNTGWCGGYDDGDFRSNEMCCGCGGGQQVVIPGSFNWKSNKPHCLDYVSNQGKCGSCYMWASLDSLSDRHCIFPASDQALGTSNHLSIQQAMVCESTGRMCAGGWASTGFDYAENGVGIASAWPYDVSCLPAHACAFGDTCSTPITEAAHKCAGDDGVFTIDEALTLETYGDAAKLAKERCSAAFELAGAAGGEAFCDEWSISRFMHFGESTVFSPTEDFCTTLHQDATKLEADFHPKLALMQEEDLLSEEEMDQNAKVGWWRRRRRDPRRRRTLCERSRCAGASRPHALTSYHWVSMDMTALKREIFLEGPIYWSFHVKGDFKWFMSNWPSHAYNHQYGDNDGGHAVVAIGWLSGCTYHTGSDSFLETSSKLPELLAIAEADPAVWRLNRKSVKARIEEAARRAELDASLASAIQEYCGVSKDDDSTGDQKVEALMLARVKKHPAGLPAKDAVALEEVFKRKGDSRRRRRRRSASGECLYLRNSWGSGWGDGGYFRVSTPGLSVGKTAYAGDGPK